MKYKFDTLVFIGRMQPFHRGHKSIIDEALKYAAEVVVVLGSSFQPRSTKNPFTFEERKAMIEACYPDETFLSRMKNFRLNKEFIPQRIHIVPVMDYPYDDTAWVAAVQRAVAGVSSGKRVGLIGHSKDHTSYYLNIFKDWRDNISVTNVDGINATDIRQRLMYGDLVHTLMPEAARSKMNELIQGSEWFTQVVEGYRAELAYHKSWEVAPYAPTFVTTDAVLHQSGYVLLIKRGGFPFKGCWALPGGYLAKGHTLVNNMIKELREETGVRVPAKVLKGSIAATQVFDHPDRDPRGRTITHGFYIDLGFPEEKLPRVRAGDDAAHAEWVKLSDVTSEMMAFDHYHIIKNFVKTYL